MSKHNPQDAADDLDDLDDVLDEFNADGASSRKPQPTSSSSSKLAPSNGVAKPKPSAADENQGDGDSVGRLGDDDDLLSEDFAQQFTQSMQALMQGIDTDIQKSSESATSRSSASEGAVDQSSGKMNEDELMKQFERLLFAGATAQDVDSVSSPSGAAARPSAASASNPRVSTNRDKQQANFQDAIAATMAKLKQSDASASSSASNNDQEAMMMQMLSALAGGEGGDGVEGFQDLLKSLGEGGDADGEEGLASMLENMMSELMSKDVLYEPLKEMRDKYPKFLASDEAKALSNEERERYEKQSNIVREIVSIFEHPDWNENAAAKHQKESSSGSATTGKAKGSRPQTEQKERQGKVQELMNEMQDCGAPPNEIVGELPPELEGMAGLGKGENGEDCTVM